MLFAIPLSKKNDMQQMPHCNTCHILPKSKVIFQNYISSFQPFDKTEIQRTYFVFLIPWLRKWHK